MHRILYIHPGSVPPSTDPTRNALAHLSASLAGDIVTTTWETAETVRTRFEQYRRALGGFGYFARPAAGRSTTISRIQDVAFFVREGSRAIRSRRPDAIVAYGPFRTALAAFVLRFLFRIPVIVEVPGNPVKSYRAMGGAWNRLRSAMAALVLPHMLRRANHLRLLYPHQALPTWIPRRGGFSVFHEFVPLSRLGPVVVPEPSRPYIFFLGSPWKLKGVDTLIRAFLKIAPAHPSTRLVIMGHCPDRSPFERLAEDHPRIEFLNADSHERAMGLMSACAVFALPSRTEACPRVLLEAMALGKPIVASRADGIPHYLHHGSTGLLVEPGDVSGLADALDQLLARPELATRLGSTARAHALGEYSEARYVAEFAQMVARVVTSTLQPRRQHRTTP